MAEFDWVKAVSDCSLPNCFERLHNGAQGDVETRNPQTAKDRIVFEATRPNGKRIMVTRSGEPIRRVDITLADEAIVVEERVGERIISSFRATPGLNSTGDCTLMVDDMELELWQVRRKALYELFFGSLPKITTMAVRKN